MFWGPCWTIQIGTIHICKWLSLATLCDNQQSVHPPIPSPLTSLCPVFQAWTMRLKIPYHPTAFPFVLHGKARVVNGELLSSLLLHLRCTYFSLVFPRACI